MKCVYVVGCDEGPGVRCHKISSSEGYMELPLLARIMNLNLLCERKPLHKWKSVMHNPITPHTKLIQTYYNTKQACCSQDVRNASIKNQGENQVSP